MEQETYTKVDKLHGQVAMIKKMLEFTYEEIASFNDKNYEISDDTVTQMIEHIELATSYVDDVEEILNRI